MLPSKSIQSWLLRIKKLKLSLSPTQDFVFAIATLVISAIVFNFIYPEPYIMYIFALALIYFITALGYNLVITVSGLFHLGFSAHFAIGAYVAAILFVNYKWETLPAVVAVVLISGIITALISIVSLRFIGDYLSIVTLAFAEIVRQVLLNWKEVTHGSNGISGIPGPIFLGFISNSPKYLFTVIVIFAGISIIIYNLLVSSRFGLAWESIRLNEEASRAMGMRNKRFKFLCLVIGSLFAGIGGLLYAHFASITDPSLSSFDVTLILITIVIFGGGSTLGILAASLVITAVPQIFLNFALFRQVAMGIFLVFAANWRPEGLSLLRKQGYARFRDKPSSSNKLKGQLSRITDEVGTEQKAVEVEGVVKRFGGLVAVKDLSMVVPRGSIFGVIGPNGAGKTTLFNLISGIYSPDAGFVRIFGKEVTNWPEWQIARLGTGRTFQNIKLFTKLTVLDNVLLASAVPTFGRPFDKKSWDVAIDKACVALEFVNLADKAKELAGSLPYGAQRRLEIARALAIQPKLLLLDEPSAGMNPKEREDLSILVKEIHAQNITIICIEHNMPFLIHIADEILVMAEGRCLAYGKPADVINNPDVIQAYLGRRTFRVASQQS